jgi:thioredoxin 1
MAGALETFNDQNWEAEVISSPKPVLVDFWATWCAPCKALVPALEALAVHYGDRVRIGKLNVEENDAVPIRYNVMALPTLLLIKGGQVAEQRTGAVSKENLLRLIDENLAS